MNTEELLETKMLLIELKKLLEMYGDSSINIQYKIVESTISIIDSDIHIEEKSRLVINNYKNLYPARGGLSDFYIKSDNYKERLELNEPLDKISDSLWNIFKNY